MFSFGGTSDVAKPRQVARQTGRVEDPDLEVSLIQAGDVCCLRAMEGGVFEKEHHLFTY